MNQPFLTELFKDQSYNKNQFFLIAGPCVVESEELVMEIADKVSGICKNLGIAYVFNRWQYCVLSLHGGHAYFSTCTV